MIKRIIAISPFVLLAAYALWHAPHPRGCLRLADAMPLAGECNRHAVNTSVHTYRGPR